jgi:RNA polymerase subunit RPABC4/transcription elongation factor Spt4
MFSACILLGASISGFITELIKGRGKYVYVSMGVAVFMCAIAFLMGYGFFKSNIITGPSTAVVPVISNLISNITLTILPGVFVGTVVGGGVGYLPDNPEINLIVEKIEDLNTVTDRGMGYEKACKRCGAVMPFDSLFCCNCGGALKKRRASNMKYCRYCGNRLHFLGEFCPDCGKEINIVSKPKVFQSN